MISEIDTNTITSWLEEFATESNKHILNNQNEKDRKILAELIVYIARRSYVKGLNDELNRIKNEI